ncbi:MAG: hypothetical protein ACD_2C00165G0001 [uncultured bacterium (gcode 4)]|uniref:Uncharacterized protein n=1 Tax=uncultured bacterium (gcode 4) TaxID=1234023 RepID=K2H0W3_9BACT|nr:MAG: hypothetical protein ACD_2C00165G0001 [uncultured bacterium (gcode 4)]
MKRSINKAFFLAIGYFSMAASVFADIKSPDSMWLPRFGEKDEIVFWLLESNKPNPHWFIVNTIAEWIKYIWLLAVLSLTIWWIMYMTSYWTDEKTKKAKNIIMYSIIWVVVSMGAFALVEIVNNINLN